MLEGFTSPSRTIVGQALREVRSLSNTQQGRGLE